MNKFEKNLTASNKEVIGTRGKRISKVVAMAQTALVNKLSMEVMNLETEIDNHTDLGRNYSTSLNFEKIGTGEEWVNKLQELKISLALKEEEYKLALETQNEWFADEKTFKTKADA